VTRKRTRKPKQRWLLCQVKPGQVDRAIEHVVRQGFEAYNPTFWNERTKRRQSLFPGYLMVECRSAWSPLNATTGIVRVITFGEAAAVVPTEDVRRLKQLENKNGNVEPEMVVLIPGEPIEVVAGRLHGLQGLYLCTEDDDRIRILFSLLGRQSSTVVRARDVQRRSPDDDRGGKPTKDVHPVSKKGL
jgi:transcriptional antiterminator RfaH